MKLRTGVRFLISVFLFISGLVETLGATGLVVELARDGHWGSGTQTLAVSGPLQIVGAVVLASGRKTRWVLIILACYVFMVSLLGDLPLIFDYSLGGNALAGLLGNVAVMVGTIYWFHAERVAKGLGEGPTASLTDSSWPSTIGVACCLAVMGGALYWLHGERTTGSQHTKPAVPISLPVQAQRAKLLI